MERAQIKCIHINAQGADTRLRQKILPTSARSADVKSSFIKREKADEKRTAAVTAAEIALHAAAADEAERTEIRQIICPLGTEEHLCKKTDL